MNLSHLSIRRTVGTLVITVLLCGLGVYSLRSQSVDMLPRMTYPLVMIRVSYPGASPGEVESNITKKIEAAVASTEDALKLTSTVTEGLSRTYLYFDYSKDIDVALNDVRARLDRVKNLPDDAEDPEVRKADPSQAPIIDLALSSDSRDEVELRTWAENEFSELFMGIQGLASNFVSGGRIREIHVVFNPNRLADYELSTGQVLAALAQENIESPGGYITSKGQEFSVRLLTKFQDMGDIRNVIIANREGELVRLKYVAQVVDTFQDQRVIVRLDGKPSILVRFLKQPNANTVAVCDEIKDKIAQLRKRGLIPEDIKTAVVSDQSYYIDNSIKSVSEALIFGGLLATLAVFLFLGSFIRTLIVAIAVPVSLLVTFFFMGIFGITINMISLGGLVLGVGMLIDNSIIMLENIARRQKIDNNRVKAAEEGSSEVGSAIVASTLTNLAAVLPFLLVTGVVILLFRDLIVTISISIIASMLTALTVVPALSARLTKYSRGKEGLTEKLASGYSRVLAVALKFRWLVIGLVLVSMTACFFCWKSIGAEFLPAIDDGRVTMVITLPVGTALSKTDGLSRKFEKIVRQKFPDVDTLYSSVGGFWQGGGVNEFSNRASIYIQLKPRGDRKISTPQFIKSLRQLIKKQKIPGANFKLTRSRIRGLRLGAAEEDIEIKLFGPDIVQLEQYAQQVMSIIKPVAGVTNLDTSLDISSPELHLIINRSKMSDFGLSARSVADTVRTVITGYSSTRYTDPHLGEDFDIRVVYDRRRLKSARDIRNIFLYPPSGVAVRLGEIGAVKSSFGPVSIEREDQVKVVRVLADVAPGFSVGPVTQSAQKALTDLKLPEPYRIEYGGEAESIAESNQALMAAALLAVFLVFGIMAVQFESLRDPLVIMFTVPFAVMGAIFALSVTGIPFSAVVFLGIILLIGIAVNDGIVMVNYFGILRREGGKGVYGSVLEGAPTRLRPVLMTSITTIFGLIPISLGLGEGSEVLAPLGVAVIGGMVLATVLTLFVIPSMYLIFNPERKK
ncbi:MAG: efflux RND transporter permease subunit [Candidatus Margulisiibacteriota bacterium]|nr:efflux RND transporter permease subunit [Candidatus Margulisiibacteriota bacterium]